MYALAHDGGRDLSQHSACETALAELVEGHLDRVINDYATGELHALVAALKKPKTPA